MDTEDRAKYLKWFRNAKSLLDQQPFTFNELCHRLYEDISDEVEMDDEIFTVIAESGLTDYQILEFLYIGYDHDYEIASDFIKSVSWDANRVWLALKDSSFNDDDIIHFVHHLGDSILSIIERLITDHWSYTRIINALTKKFEIGAIISAFLDRGCNDFRIIEILQLSNIEHNLVLDNLPSDWSFDRTIKALHSAGYHYNHIADILFNYKDEEKNVIKAMLLVWPDPLLVAKIALAYNNDLMTSLILALKDSTDTISDSSEILEQLEKDGDEIAGYLENGHFS